MREACKRCKKPINEHWEKAYSQGNLVCLDCKKTTKSDDGRAFDLDMESRRKI